MNGMSKSLLTQIMLTHMNLPYIYGGKNPLLGLDCSGLVCCLLKSVHLLGTNEDLGSQELHDRFLPQSDLDVRDLGSLAFYGTDGVIDHVTMMLDSEFMIEAGHGTPQTLTRDIAAHRGAYTRVRHIDYRQDFIKVFRPKYFATLT